MAEVLPNNDNLVNAPIQNELLPLESDLVTDPLLPPNTEGGDVGSRVDAATIGAFSPNGEQVPASDLAFIQQQIDPLSGQQLALGNVTQEDFTPGINLPLRVGGTSGQLTGSRDIFVPRAQAVPFALLERRRAAQQQAALKRAEDLSKAKGLPEIDKINDARFNRNLVNTFNDFTKIFEKRALNLAGGDQEVARELLTDTRTEIGRDFATQVSNLNQLAGEFNQIADDVAKIKIAQQKGGQFVSKADRDLVSDFDSLQKSFKDGDPFNAVNLLRTRKRIGATRSLEGVLKDTNVLASVKASIIKTAKISNDELGNFITTTEGKKVFDKAVEAILPGLERDAAIAGRFTRKQLRDEILPRFGSEITTEKKLQLKRKPSAGAFGSKADVPISNQPKIIDVNGSQFKTTSSVPFPKKTQSKPVRVDGLIVVGSDGKLTTKEGISNFIPVELSIIEVGNIKNNIVRGQIVNERGELEDITVDFDNIKTSLKGLSRDARLTVEAFEDISNENTRKKRLIDKDNLEGDFLDEFVQSGINDVDEFIDSLSNEQKVDVILNDETREAIKGVEFQKKVVRERREQGKLTRQQNSAIFAFMKANNLSRSEAIKILKENNRL